MRHRPARSLAAACLAAWAVGLSGCAPGQDPDAICDATAMVDCADPAALPYCGVPRRLVAIHASDGDDACLIDRGAPPERCAPGDAPRCADGSRPRCHPLSQFVIDCDATHAECRDLWDYPATPLPASVVICEAEIDTATGMIGPAVARAP